MMPDVDLGAMLRLTRADLPIFFVLFDAFLWYYLTLNVIAGISVSLNMDYMVLLFLHAMGVLAAGAIGLFSSRNRYKLLLLWTALGTITALLPIFDLSFSVLNIQLVCIAWGFSFGLGMPSCLGYFTEVIPVERRGRIAGASLLLSFLCAIVIDALVRMLGFQMLGFLFMYSSFGILRLLGFIPLLSLGLEKVSTHRQGDGEHFGLSKVFDRRLGLYLVPWFIFNVIDTVEGLLLKDVVKGIFPDYYSLMQFVLLFSLSAFVLVGGILSDFIGRKPMVIVGLSTMGMAYALISIIPNNLAVWFFYFVSDGLAWGLFYTIFIAVIWGDLAPRGLEQLYYYVGSIPFFLASIVQITLASSVKLLNSTSAFSLAAIFLFLAVLPILFASETLPEKKIQERQVRDYVEKAKKLKEKHV